MKHRKSITKTLFEKTAKMFDTPSAFRKAFPSICTVGYRRGWMKTHRFKRKRRTADESKHEVFANAKKCRCRSDFQKKYPADYDLAYRYGWLDKMTWFVRELNPYKDKTYIVYGYFFTAQKSVYIGITCNKTRRKWEHCHSNESPVLRFSNAHKVLIPRMSILEHNLSPEHACEAEERFVNYYSSLGWNVLNVAKTGKRHSSLGACGYKWTKEKCFAIAKLCQYISEFKKQSPSAYQASCKNGWIDDWFKVKRTAPIEIYQYTTNGEFVGSYPNSYIAAKAVTKCKSGPQKIRDCCNRKSATAFGFVWRNKESSSL